MPGAVDVLDDSLAAAALLPLTSSRNWSHCTSTNPGNVDVL